MGRETRIERKIYYAASAGSTEIYTAIGKRTHTARRARKLTQQHLAGALHLAGLGFEIEYSDIESS